MISVPCISLFQRLFITKAIREKYKRTKRYRQYCLYRKYPSLAKNRGDQCSLMQQFTHPVHPKSSYCLRTCFGGKAGKIRNTGSRQEKCKRKETKQSKDNSTVQAKYFSQEKGILHLISLPLSNCLLSSVDHVAILFCCCFSVGLTNLRTSAGLVVVVVSFSSSSTPTSC